MIFLAGQHIENLNGFSQNFLSILNIIKDGYNWLKWALDDPSLSVYYAQNEQDLLIKVQNGLHETPLLRSTSFIMNIEKAMSVEDPDLEMLEQVFQNNAVDSSITESLSQRYGLVTNEQLQSNQTFLEKFDLQQSPLFQSMPLREGLAIYKLQQETKNTPVVQEAIAFAQQYASSALEFIHYVKFYQGCVANQLTGKVTASIRPQLVTEIYEQLRALCYQLIYVPNIGSFEYNQDISGYLRDFVLNAKFIGYYLVPAAMENLVKNIKVKDVSETELKNSIESYMTSIKQRVMEGSFTADPLPQDGWLRSFTCESDNFKVIVQVSFSGEVFLSPASAPITTSSNNDSKNTTNE